MLTGTYVWSEAEPADLPEPVFGQGIGYDASRDRVGMFGGGYLSGGMNFNAPPTKFWHWEYALANWNNEVVTPNPVPSEFEFTFTYDSVRDEWVWCGGVGFGVVQTWTLDGDATVWTQKSPSSQPENGAAVAVWDAAGNRVIRFGGDASASVTWEWDGSEWTDLSPSTTPPGRESAVMAYDVHRDVVVMYGGTGALSTVLDDQWEFDGTDWSQVFPSTTPGAIAPNGMAYYVHRRSLIIVKGAGSLPGATVWEYLDGDWTEYNPPVGPVGANPNIVYNEASDLVMLQGINDGSTSSKETWFLVFVPDLPPTQYQRIYGWRVNISDDALETVDPLMVSPETGPA